MRSVRGELALESARRLLSLLLVFALSSAPLLAETTKGASPSKPRVFLIGWDGGDWGLLDPLMKEGKLPNLAMLIAKGRSWDLETYQPMASPLIWTTIATGRNPIDHGVTDFQELDPKTKSRLPISGRSRKVPAIWNLASAKGRSVGVVGWWATWPAERVNGFFVSDRASPVLFDPELLSRSSALTWPEGLADGVRIVSKREGTPPFEEIGRFLKISRAEFDSAVAKKLDLGHPITAFQKILGSTRVHARIGLEMYEREKPDLLMVYFQGTDEIGHVMARFHPPRLPTTPEEDFQKYSAGVVSYYLEADRILGEFMKKAERDGATVIVVSDHGFRWGDSRPAYYSGTRFDTAFLWHQSPGMMAAAGPGVVPAKARGKASVFDVAPTLCRLLGLPPDPVFEGKTAPGFGGKAIPAPVAAVSWEKTARVERLTVSSNSADEKRAAEEFTKKLIALGYLTGSEASAVDARPADRAGTETAGSFANVGTYLRIKGQPEKAIEWYRKALDVNPKSATVWYNLSVTLHMLDRWDESDDALIEAARNGYQDPEATIFRRVATYMQRFEKRPEARAQLLSFLKKTNAAFPQNDRYLAALGKVMFENQDCAGSEKIFRGLVVRLPNDVEVLNLLALTSWCQGRLAEAREFFKRSLAQKADQPAVREGLAQLERGGKFAQ